MTEKPTQLVPLTELANRLYMLSEGKRDLLLIIVLVVIPLLFLANVLFTDKVLVGDNLATHYPWTAIASEELLRQPTNGRVDPLHQYYPHRVIAAEIVRTGDLPLWNPYYLAGTPFLATEPLAGFFYPPNIIYYLLDPLKGFGLSAYLHLVLAGMFMYFYLRSIQLDRISSLFGAVSFELSGYFLINLMWLSRVATAVWAPLLFFSFEKYWGEKRWGYAILIAVGVGMSILAGTPPVVVFVMFGLVLYSILRFFLSLNDMGFIEATRAMAVIYLAIGLGVLLAAVQLIPTYEATPFFERAHWSYEEAWDTGRSPRSLTTALVPDVLVNYWRPNIFAGILPLLLGFWALAFRRNTFVLFSTALAILSLSLFLNVPNLVYRILYIIPVFRVGRLVEVKVTYAFALCVLAAWGFSSLIREEGWDRSRMDRASKILLVIAIAALVGITITEFASTATYVSDFLPGWYLNNIRNFVRVALLVLACAVALLLRVREKIGAHLYGFLAIALVVMDMFYFGWKLNPPQRASDLFFETDSIRFLEADHDFFRIMRGPDGGRVLPPNTAAVYGISDAQGYSSLILDYYKEFMNLVEPNITTTIRVRAVEKVESLSSKLLDVLNAKYILVGADVGEELLWFDEAHKDIDLVYDGEIKIYENKDVLPRAFVVHEFEVLTGKEDILAELASEQFDPAAYVILEEEPELEPASGGAFARQSSADILEYRPNKVTIEAEMSSDGFLVLSDLYYEGWRAFVDGEEQTVYKADYIFRAIQLPQGRHTVEFVFVPLSFKIGLALSTISLLIIGSLLAYALLGKALGLCSCFRLRNIMRSFAFGQRE